jgi:hypothetical protein
MSETIAIIIMLAAFIGCFYFIRGAYQEAQGHAAKPLRPVTQTSKTTHQSAQALIAELRSALTVREETIKDLREKGKRAVADRDRWEAEAKKCRSLKTGAGGVPGYDADKFRELKAALAKMFHPDALRSASNFERVVREELFKEINVEIDRIDGKRREAGSPA